MRLDARTRYAKTYLEDEDCMLYKINFSLQLFGYRFVFALAKYLVKHLSIIVPLIEEPSTS